MTTNTTDDGEKMEWRCFHCGEAFTDKVTAREHFGEAEMDRAACVLNATERGIVGLYREAMRELNRYRMEDHESHRAFYVLGADHAAALRREEEKGYARGLADGRADGRAQVREYEKALAALEAANNSMAAARPQSLYLAAIDAGLSDHLQALDDTRREARRLLSTPQPAPTEGGRE